MSDVIYPMRLTWRGGNLASAEIGGRVIDMVQRFGPLDPAMSNWLLLDRPRSKWVRLDTAPAMTPAVERNVWRNDFTNAPEHHLGYGLVLKGSKIASDYGTNDSINISMDVGSWSLNNLEFEVGDISQPPDLSLVTYPIYKGALETLVSVWPCPWAYAYAHTLSGEGAHQWDGISPIAELIKRKPKGRGHFEVAWIAYLSAPLAKNLTPPPEIAWEPTPGGGMILSASETRFDQDNPEHMHRSRALQAILHERVGTQRWSPNDPNLHEPYLPARVGLY